MALRKIRKMQVPAYCAVDDGVQEREKRGVVVEVRKVMDMVEEDMSMEELDVAIDMPDVGVAVVVLIDMLMSILRDEC